MRYVSTRRCEREARSFSFEEAVTTGIAEDGGLFLPERLPDLGGELREWLDESPRPSFPELVRRLLRHFVPEHEVPRDELDRLVRGAFATSSDGAGGGPFYDPAVAPVVAVGPRPLLVAELFHGPTAAFKDLAMLLLSRLVDYFLRRAGRRASVLVATSGDTGPAAAVACAGLASIDCFVVFPQGRVSPTQRRQMTTAASAGNVHVYEVRGATSDSLDDVCARLTGDLAFRRRVGLLSMNSFNLGRVVLQCAHFFHAYLEAVPHGSVPPRGAPLPEVLFSLPSGALGNAVGARMARGMGLPARLVLCTNNAVLPTLYAGGPLARPASVPHSVSPAIDIGVPYNVERLFYYASGGRSDEVRALMRRFERDGSVRVPWTERLCEATAAVEVGEAATLEAMRRAYDEHRYVLDPHTAVGVAGAEAWTGERLLGRGAAASRRLVCVVATAHPAKFPETVRRALGGRYPVATPPSLARAVDPAERDHAEVLPQDALEAALRRAMAAAAPRAAL